MGTAGRAERRQDEQPLPLLSPMLAATAAGLPADPDRFAFEPKLDGFRSLAYVEHGQLRLRSRGGRPLHGRLPELAALGQALPGRRLILDGEIVALVNGKPSFEALQQRMRTRRPEPGAAPALLCLFDLLWLDGTLLTGRPYRQRRELLDELDLTGPGCEIVPWVVGHGQVMLDAVVDQGLEGVLAKRLTSPYRPGVRSDDWRKVYATRVMTAVVGGVVVAGDGQVEALVVGVPHPAGGGRLRYAAHVDHGLSPTDRRELADLLLGLRTDDSPFLGQIPTAGWSRPPRPIVFVRPEVNVRIAHRGQEPSGRLRHPAYARRGSSAG